MLCKRALSAVVLVLASASAATPQIPVGPEIHVNTWTTSIQRTGGVALDGAGNFVVVWESLVQDGSGPSVHGQRFDAAGNAVGAEFRANTYTTSAQYSPRVAAGAGGGFVVVWQSLGQDGSDWGVFARRFSALGAPLGLEFRVNEYTTNAQSFPAVRAAADGSFVIAWSSAGQDGHDLGVFARRYDATGAPLGSEFRVNTYTTGRQALPDIALAADGGFVIAWDGIGPGGNGLDVFARRFGAGGAPLGDPVRVNTYTTLDQFRPLVSPDAAGNFVVAWLSYGQEGSPPTFGIGTYAQRFDASGVSVGGELHVNAFTTGNQTDAAVAMDQSGDFVVAWTSEEDGSERAVMARRYDAAGTPEGPAYRLNTYTPGAQSRPVLAARPDGDFVAAWTSPQDGSETGIVGQRFVPEVIFKDGFEAGDLGVWSFVATDGGDLAVSTDAAMRSSTAGLQGLVDDTAGLYVQDDSPHGEPRYRARFYFDPHGFDPGEAQAHRRMRIFLAFAEPSRRVAALVLRRIGGAYSLRARARRDDNTQADTAFAPISDGPHAIEIELRRATGPDANDGSLSLWIDGVGAGSLASLDNSLSAVDFVRLGALSVKSGANGTLYWDEFESRRLLYVGP